MAVTTVRAAVKYECDGCSYGVVTLPGDEPPGIGGTVREVHDGGGTGDVRWWACKRDHIFQAIVNALEKAH